MWDLCIHDTHKGPKFNDVLDGVSSVRALAFIEFK